MEFKLGLIVIDSKLTGFCSNPCHCQDLPQILTSKSKSILSNISNKYIKFYLQVTPPGESLLISPWALCSTDTSIMEPCPVRNVSDTCQTYMSCVFLRIYHMFTCRVHFNVVMSVQHSMGLKIITHSNNNDKTVVVVVVVTTSMMIMAFVV